MPKEPSQITFLIVCTLFTSVAVFIILFVLLYNSRQRKNNNEKLEMQKKFDFELLQSQAEVQEETLSSLAKELHDNICQLLSSTKLLLGTSRIINHSDPDILLTAEETVGTAISELRSVSKSLNKEWLQKFKLCDNLQAEVNRLNAAKVISVNAICPDNLFLSTDKQIILFRIIQEATQNAIKHAAPKSIQIILAIENNDLHVSITDDGIGLHDNNVDGQGFTNVKNRVSLLNGKINWLQPASGGCVVDIFIPIIAIV